MQKTSMNMHVLGARIDYALASRINMHVWDTSVIRIRNSKVFSPSLCFEMVYDKVVYRPFKVAIEFASIKVRCIRYTVQV